MPTLKQRDEVLFISRFSSRPPSEEEIREYFDYTSRGVGEWNWDNSLMLGKRNFELTSKTWRQDLLEGILTLQELREDFGEFSTYRRWEKSLLKSLRRKHGIPDG